MKKFIKITQCSVRGSWYEGRISEEFEVTGEEGEFYQVQDEGFSFGVKLVFKHDCQIVDKIKNYVAIKQGTGEGCDYTIGCNIDVEYFEAPNFDEAQMYIENQYAGGQDDRIESIHIIEVTKDFTYHYEDFLIDEEEEEDEEYQEYLKLKEKYEGKG